MTLIHQLPFSHGAGRDETPETKCAFVMKEEAAQLSLAAGFVYVTPSAAVPGFIRKQESPDINISVEKN